MTPEQIRAEATERIARAEYTSWLERVRARYVQDGEECPHLPWDDAPDGGEWGRDRWRSAHVANVHALGDLLPVGVQESVDTWSDGRGRIIRERRQVRYVGEWREVER